MVFCVMIYKLKHSCLSISFLPQYCELPNITIGGYDFAFDDNNTITPVSMSLRQYAQAYFNTSTNTYILNGTIIESELDGVYLS